MPAPLNRETVQQRLLGFQRDNFLYIGSFMRSVVLAAGTLVLLEICANLSELWSRLLPWFASLLAVIVTYTTWGRGILLTNSRGNLWDVASPLLMGINEFFLFAVLSQRLSSQLPQNLWRWWLIAVGFHVLLAAGLVNNRIRQTSLQNDFEPALQALGIEYERWLKTDRRETMIGAGLAFVLGGLALTVLSWSLQGACYAVIYDVLTVPFIGIFAYVSWRSDEQRRRIDEYVFDSGVTEQGAQPGT